MIPKASGASHSNIHGFARRPLGHQSEHVCRPQDGAQHDQDKGLPCPCTPQCWLTRLALFATWGFLLLWFGAQTSATRHVCCRLTLIEHRCEFLPSARIAVQGQVEAGPSRHSPASCALRLYFPCRPKERPAHAAPVAVQRRMPRSPLPALARPPIARRGRLHRCLRPPPGSCPGSLKAG